MGKSKLRLLPSSLSRLEDGIPTTPPSSEQLHKAIRSQFETVLAFAGGDTEQTFKTFEKALVVQVFELARLLIALFFSVREQHEQAGIPSHLEIDGRSYQRRPAQARNFNTLFGVVRYWRADGRGPCTGGGASGAAISSGAFACPAC